MWDEGGSGGKRIHLASNNGVNKDLNKRIDEEKDWGTEKQNQELKQEVKEYQLLDRYIKKENEQLKETNQQIQDEHEETSNKLKKVL
jgi:predicted AlkP superfamily phosphohydrolase/phosphomutase